ncbi:hypothetical protein C4J81_11160 [Deltaproteobacteria bacterium Smac51]|nr:hypothetical protein C4J81_11160 [Deltaproteobacteria bacterium Smac51]
MRAAILPDPGGCGGEGLFSPAELESFAAVKSPAARHSRMISRLAAKVAGGCLWGMSPEELELRKGPEGRPDLWRTGGNERLGFLSISHTAGAAAAVAGRVPVGIDIERTGRVLKPSLINWAFTAGELKLADRANEEDLPHLAMWCAREAAGKSWGIALLNHFDQVRVTGADWNRQTLTVSWLGPENYRAEVLLGRAGDFLLALAGAESALFRAES